MVKALSFCLVLLSNQFVLAQQAHENHSFESSLAEAQNQGSKNVPDWFGDYIKGELTQKVEIRKVVKPRRSTHISKKQALEDLETFRYLIHNAYAARDYWESNGLVFDDEFQRIKKFIDDAKGPISVFDFYTQVSHTFRQGGRDGHLGMELMGRRQAFVSNLRVCFVDGIVCEKQGDHFVALTANKVVKKGDRISGCDFYPTLAPKGKQYYLPGKRSFTKITDISAKINGKAAKLPVHLCRIRRNMRGKYIFKHLVEQGIDIVDSPTFIDTFDYKNGFKKATELKQLGEKLRSKKTVIFDITSNHGGEIRYTQQFVAGLNGYATLEMHSAHLVSPAAGYLSEEQEKELKGIRKWIIHKGQKTDSRNGKFEGKLILLTDSGVASSGEGTVGYCRSFKDKLVIGENTAGIVNFGNVQPYLLENSGIKLSLSNGIFLGLCREGEGFQPNYWVDAPNVRKEVLKWLNDNDSYFPPVE